MVTIEINSVEELKGAAEKLFKAFADKRVFAFYGSMGAGKTTFIKAICRHLGSIDNITSPTFALVNEYDTPESGKIFHFDFYRIKNIEEAMDIGFEDYLFSNQYCFMEWPEKIEGLLPENFIKVSIEESANGSRIIKAVEL